MTKKEQAKSDFIDKFGTIPMLDVTSISSIFNYMQCLNGILDTLYETAYHEGFQKAVNFDEHKN